MAPVHDAAERNDVEELGRLLDEDLGLIESGDDDDRTPLFCASRGGAVDAVRLLLDRGADADWQNGLAGTALSEACCYGRVEVARLLLERGADPSVRAHGGVTALMGTLRGAEHPGSDHVAVIRLLIQDGRVPVNARDNRGCTALWHACWSGYTERARVLLVEGSADHTVPGDAGLNPMAVAQWASEEGCIRLFQWYEGELHRAFLLSKARAVVDATHTITKAPDKAQAQTQAQAQRAREQAAPAWLRGRVVGGEALPDVEVVGQAGQHEEEGEEEELCAVCGWLVDVVSEDLWVEVMAGLRYRWWVPGEAKVEGGGAVQQEE